MRLSKSVVLCELGLDMRATWNSACEAWGDCDRNLASRLIMILHFGRQIWVCFAKKRCLTWHFSEAQMLKLLAIRVEVEKYSGCLKYLQCTSQMPSWGVAGVKGRSDREPLTNESRIHMSTARAHWLPQQPGST